MVVIQEGVHFGFQFIQVLLFDLQGTHQFLLRKKRFSNHRGHKKRGDAAGSAAQL